MIPALRLLWLLGAWVLLGVACSVTALPLWAWQAAGAGLALLVAIDTVRLRALGFPDVHRDVPATLALGRDQAVGLRLRAPRAMTVEVFDHFPGNWEANGLPVRLPLTAGPEAQVSYRVRPVRRGAASFAGCDLRVISPFGLVKRQGRLDVRDNVRVFPDFSPLARLALISVERAGRVTGAHLQRRRGEGTEFDQLREFRIGDSLRQVDWKATMRMRRPISREYQDERNQQVVVLLDQGRRMLAHDHGLSHFDHVLNATLMLGYIALRQGDAFGVMPAAQPARWLAPLRGGDAINAIMNTIHALEAFPVATDYLAAAGSLAVRQQRRALVVLVTNLRDEDSEDMLAAVRLLARRHVVCVASLREQALDDVLARPATNTDDMLLAGGVLHYLESRRRTHDLLRAAGIAVLDVTSSELPGAITDAYLSVKRSGRL